MSQDFGLVEDLYQALWSLSDDGATLAAIAEQPALMELALVRPAAGDDEPAKAKRARQEIVSACRMLNDRSLAVDPDWRGEGPAVLALLGLATGFRSAPPHRRRQGAADQLGYEVIDTAFKTRPGVRSHVQNAVYAAADLLFEREIGVRAATSARSAPDKRPDLGDLAGDLIPRYEAYYTMYSPLSGLRADLSAALQLREEGDSGINEFEDFVGSSLHNYAHYMVAKDRFVNDLGGLWVFGQADVEQGVADAIKLIEHFSGLKEREESYLRLTQTSHPELHELLSEIETDKVGQSISKRWKQRIDDCHCDPLSPSTPDCKLHAQLSACKFYIDALDTDWYRVIPWHQQIPSNLGVIDPATLYRDVGLAPPEF